MKRIALIIMLALAAGCATTSSPPDTSAYKPTNGVIRRAIVAGLTAVDPDEYQGWSGACPGCDLDAQRFAALCRSQAVQTVELHNKQATIDGLLGACKAAVQGMKSGDLLILFVSGHGGQIRDTNGDEADGQDETLCLWDGELSDDVLYKAWLTIPAGVRVLFISDTCNSGTNFKTRYTARKIRKSVPRKYAGALIHYGGCADGHSSLGAPDGGAWTLALLAAWQDGQSYQGWYNRAASRMTSKQVPVYAEYGAVTDWFRNGEALK